MRKPRAESAANARARRRPVGGWTRRCGTGRRTLRHGRPPVSVRARITPGRAVATRRERACVRQCNILYTPRCSGRRRRRRRRPSTVCFSVSLLSSAYRRATSAFPLADRLARTLPPPVLRTRTTTTYCSPLLLLRYYYYSTTTTTLLHYCYNTTTTTTTAAAAAAAEAAYYYDDDSFPRARFVITRRRPPPPPSAMHSVRV